MRIAFSHTRHLNYDRNSSITSLDISIMRSERLKLEAVLCRIEDVLVKIWPPERVLIGMVPPSVSAYACACVRACVCACFSVCHGACEHVYCNLLVHLVR